jgi:hypothetical protein
LSASTEIEETITMNTSPGRFRDPMSHSWEELFAAGAKRRDIERMLSRHGGPLPRMAGGAEAPVTYPLDPVSVSGTEITLDQYVNSPTVITRMIAEYSQLRMYAHKVFSPGPGVEGGAILFERPNPLLTDLFAERRTQEVAPGSQFPVQKFLRGVPMVAKPRKIGERFQVTKEDKKRNNPQLILNAIVQASNTLVRDIEIMALGELNAVIAAETRTVAGQSWTTASEQTFSTKTARNQPIRDLINAQTVIDLEERGYKVDSAIINPLDWANLVTIYGADAVAGVLASVGITDYTLSPRQVAGKVKLYQAGLVGVWSNEFPLSENEWEEKETESWWYQWSVSPTFAVTNQFTVIELTGVA